MVSHNSSNNGNNGNNGSIYKYLAGGLAAFILLVLTVVASTFQSSQEMLTKHEAAIKEIQGVEAVKDKDLDRRLRAIEDVQKQILKLLEERR